MATRLADYLLYLAYLTRKLDGFFEKQYPYIFCKKGCSRCCENGEYPFSRLEYDFIMIGFTKLPPELREEILSKVKRLKAEKEKFSPHPPRPGRVQIIDKNPSTLQPFNSSTVQPFNS